MSSFDVSDYVEAPQGQETLLFSNEKQQARFELAVTLMIHKWDALTIAVDNKWGGPDSSEKRDWISGLIIDAFKSEKIIDVGFIEDTLLYAMIDEFDTNVEDDSALPIASYIINAYRECLLEKYEEIEQLYVKWQEYENNKKTGVHVEITEDPLNPDISDDEEEDEEEYIEHHHEHNHNHTEAIIDDDGFELVQKKGARKH